MSNEQENVTAADRGDLGPIELKVNPLLVDFEGPAVAIGVSILVPADRESFAMHTLNVMGAALAANDGKLVLNGRTGVNVVYDVDRVDDVQEELSEITDPDGEGVEAALSITTDIEGEDK